MSFTWKKKLSFLSSHHTTKQGSTKSHEPPQPWKDDDNAVVLSAGIETVKWGAKDLRAKHYNKNNNKSKAAIILL